MLPHETIQGAAAEGQGTELPKSDTYSEGSFEDGTHEVVSGRNIPLSGGQGTFTKTISNASSNQKDLFNQSSKNLPKLSQKKRCGQPNQSNNRVANGNSRQDLPQAQSAGQLSIDDNRGATPHSQAEDDPALRTVD